MAFTPDDVLHNRYGDRIPDIDPVWNATLETLLNHRSIRAYRPDPLPPGTLEALIAAAQSASTSSNLQTWSVVAVTSADRKQRLSMLAGNQPYIRQCPLFLVWLADLARLAYIGEQRGLPHSALNSLELFVTATIDAALAAQNAAIAAESLGLGMVYIGGLRNDPQGVAATLHLPPQVFAVFGMCVGYPDVETTTAVKPRLPQAAVLHAETYSLPRQDAAIAQYNQVMQTFYEQQQMKGSGDWALHSLRRVAGPESLSGRDRLKEILNDLGFPLL